MRSLFPAAVPVYSPAMVNVLAHSLAALFAMVPATVFALRRGADRSGLFLTLLVLAAAGPTLWSAAQLADSWHSDLFVTLWVGVAAAMLLFLAVATLNNAMARLAPLMLPYLVLLGAVATVIGPQTDHPLAANAPAVWLQVHIGTGVITYGLLTLAALAALAGFLQERALKTKQPTALSRLLPSVVDSELCSRRLLLGSEVVLGLGLISGSITSYLENGRPLVVDHKTLLSIAAFVVIGALVGGQRVCGVRGRMAARMVLLAYLLVTLAYPGVKFVRQVLLG